MPEVPTYPRLRDDITFSRVVLRGRVTFVAKDPVRRKYLQFDPLGRRLCDLCDGERTEEDILTLLQSEFPDHDLDLGYIRDYLEHLIRLRLILKDRLEYNILLMEKTRRNRQKRNTLLHMTFPALDPDRMFDWLIERIRWMGSRPFALFYWLFVLASYVVLLVEYEATWRGIASFYVFSGWSAAEVIALYLVIILIMVVHEFGHGLTCKYYGGEVHQMGFLLIYLINPALYCNVSDSYRFPERRQRLMVVYGGPLVELFIGSVFVYVWWLTDPGLHLHDFAFKIVLFSSISSWIFNMNPLLKYDGYYALSELTDIPNLRKRSFDHLGWHVKRLFGLPGDPAPGGRYERRVYLVYSILAFCYSLFVFSLIFSLLKRWLVGGMAALGWVLLALAMWLLLRRFIRKGFGFLRLAALDNSGFIRRHVPLVVSVLVLLIVLPAVVRRPTPIDLPAWLEPAEYHDLTASATGPVREVFVESGAVVESGEVLLRQESPALAYDLAGVDREIMRLRLAAGRAVQGGGDEETNLALVQTQRLEVTRRVLRTRSQDLVVRAPLTGRILSSGVDGLRDRIAREGEVFLRVGRTDSLRARLVVSEQDMTDIGRGTRCLFKPAADPWTRLEGRVVAIGHLDEDREGLLAGYRVEVMLDNRDSGLIPGQEGTVRLLGRRRSLWGRFLRTTLQTLRLDFFF